MKSFILFSLFLCFLLPFSFSQVAIEPLPGIGARVVGLGNAYTAVSGNLWSVFHNPASITGGEGLELGTYVEQRYFLKELTYGSAAALYPFAGNQAAGLSLSSQGFSGYRQNSIGLTYGITLFDHLSLGARVNAATLAIAGYGSVATIFADFGAHYAINEELAVGASMYNVSQARLNTQLGEELLLPSILSAGLSYRPGEKVMIVADVQKHEGFPASFRGGIEYEISELIIARIGTGTEPLVFSGGVGVNWEGLQLDISMSYTERVQYSPHFSLSYLIGKSEED
jgi:hypothetical protein